MATNDGTITSRKTTDKFDVRILKKREKRRTTYAMMVGSNMDTVLDKVREVLERPDFIDGLVEIEKVQ